MAGHPRVVSVFPNRGHPLHTTRSWEFLGMEEEGGRVRPGSIWAKAKFGEGVVIGNLDTGNTLLPHLFMLMVSSAFHCDLQRSLACLSLAEMLEIIGFF